MHPAVSSSNAAPNGGRAGQSGLPHAHAGSAAVAPPGPGAHQRPPRLLLSFSGKREVRAAWLAGSWGHRAAAWHGRRCLGGVCWAAAAAGERR